MANYTKNDVLDQLGGRTVMEVAECVDCHFTTVYAYLNKELSGTSKTRLRIDQLLGIDTESVIKPSVKEYTGLGALEIAELAGVSKASVHNWHNRVLQIKGIKQPIDQRIETALAQLEK